MKNYFSIIYLSFILISISCSEKHKPYKLPDNAATLLHGNGSKSWKIARRYNNDIRMNMGPCFLEYRQTFVNDKSVMDNNDKNNNCGPSLTGEWQFKTSSKGDPYIKISSPDIPELLNTDKDYKYFKVLKLTRDTLKISFEHKQYGNTSRTITDILVREDLDIGDRYFHH